MLFGYSVFFWGDENALELGKGGGCRMYEVPHNCSLLNDVFYGM